VSTVEVPPRHEGSDPVSARPGARGTGQRRQRISVLASSLERFGLLILFGVLIAVFSWLRPETFATEANWQVIAVSQSVLVVAAVALIVPLVGGRFDVSVGANLGLCSILCSGLMSRDGVPLIVAIVLAVLVGVTIGVINGLVVAFLGVNSIIATLGMSTILGGLVSAYTNGIPITSGLPTSITGLSGRTIVGVPVLFVLALIIAALVWVGLTQTPYGRELSAIGSNLRAANLVGINVRRKVLLSFVISGALAGVAGVLQLAATGSGDPSVGGINFIVPALAAVFLGATTWQPGKYNVPGAVLGLLFVSAAVSGLALLGVRPWVSDVFNGGAVVLAIIVSAHFRRRRSGVAEVGS
jgi:ribose transport system permease protein